MIGINHVEKTVAVSLTLIRVLSILKLEQKRKKESNYDAYSFTQRRSC